MEKLKISNLPAYDADEKLLEDMKKAYMACPQALKYCNELGIPAEKIDENIIKIYDSALSSGDAQAFKTAMNGVYLIYELDTPTTESATPYTELQNVDNWGTEEYVDERDVAIPVGHNTKYLPDLKAKLESAPNAPSSDGDYLVRHANGVNNYVQYTKELPDVPSTNGTYALKATRTASGVTYSWDSTS